MKKGKITILFLLTLLMTITTSFGQNIVYSTIAKNINSEANSLQHNLNRSGDTLHLSSDFNLYKVEFIGSYNAKVFEVERGKRQISIALASVPVGEYTIAAFQIEKSDDIYQYQKTIVFRISRLLPIEDLKVEEELIAEVEPEPEIIEEEPIIKEEEAVVAVVKKEEPAKKERVKKERIKKEKVKRVIKEKKPRVVKTRTPKPKKEKVVRPEKKKRVVVKKERIKKEITKEKKTRVVTKKPVAKERPVRTKPERPARVVETKKPSLDSTEYKSYNLTNGRDGRYVVQSREEYRAENLRPNGQPYE